VAQGHSFWFAINASIFTYSVNLQDDDASRWSWVKRDIRRWKLCRRWISRAARGRRWGWARCGA